MPLSAEEILDLICYHGRTQAQVAELFQVNVRTVRRWWESVLVKLHRELKDEESTGGQS
jgi:DNA-directed RNA polymerase specialized sigma24 family protein